MCGVAGIWYQAGAERAALNRVLRGMADPLRARGPDAEGFWESPDEGIGLAHRRLAIVDLSPEGLQPMASASGRYVMVFNGEIYNHRELRDSLAGAGRRWRGRSDTEVMLALIESRGLEGALDRFEGMFALALWDREERRLHLAVDRMGEKPLYYGIQAGALAFGSELKALRSVPGWRFDLDRDALPHYLRYGYIPAPLSIHAGIFKLAPGHLLSLGLDEFRAGRRPGPKPYWSLVEAWDRARSRPFTGSDAEAVDSLDGLLKGIISDQLMADVPVGVFLSGGIDSTAVAAVAQAVSASPIRTFTIGFGQKEYDEAGPARKVAAHLGTQHTELVATPDDARKVIPDLPRIYDEPFADSSQIPTWLVSSLGRKHVTVSLSGDGGDEVFGGYNRYTWGVSLARKMERIPVSLRKAAALGIGMVPPRAWDRIWGPCQGILPRRLQVSKPGEKLHKIAGNLASADGQSLYQGLVSYWRHPEEVLAGPVLASVAPGRIPVTGFGSIAEWMMVQDMAQYLPGDILTKVDRAAMSVSLETRAPFLNHRLVEWGFALPLQMKIRDGRGKHLLRALVDRYVPRDLVERPKMGFALPLQAWLRGPLREWAGDLLSADRLRREGYFRPEAVERKWKEHQSGYRDWTTQLWTVLMFEAWLSASAP
jgi:asparagine synthase (glutamine-hydrolysing)